MGPTSNNHVQLSTPLLKKINYELQKIYGVINLMNEDQLDNKLLKYNLSADGDIKEKRNCLKLFYKNLKLSSLDIYVSDKLVPYYVVVDFEATCEEQNPVYYKHEIIEFPAVLINSKTLAIEDSFRMIVRPKIKFKLSEFCIKLTGITQKDVNTAKPFEEVLQHFNDWLASHRLGTEHKFAIVTDGPWDICRFLFTQCYVSKIEIPKWAKQYINIRKSYCHFYRRPEVSLASMLGFLNMQFEGRPHCGLDDAKNIARVLITMICDGAGVQINEGISMKSMIEHRKIVQELEEIDDLTDTIEKLTFECEKERIHNKMISFNNAKRERIKAEQDIAKSFSMSTLENEKEISATVKAEENNTATGTKIKHRKQKQKSKK